MLSVDTKISIYGCDRISEVNNMDIKSAFLVDEVSNSFVYAGLSWWCDLINSYYLDSSNNASHNPPNYIYLSDDRDDVKVDEGNILSNPIYNRDFWIDNTYIAEDLGSNLFAKKINFWANFPFETARHIYYSVGLGYDDGVNKTKYTRAVFSGVGKTEFIGLVVKYELYVTTKKSIDTNSPLIMDSFLDAVMDAIEGGNVDLKVAGFYRVSDGVWFCNNVGNSNRSKGILTNASSQANRNYIVNTFWSDVASATDGVGNTMAWNDEISQAQLGTTCNEAYPPIKHTFDRNLRVDRIVWFFKIVTEI